MDPTYLKLFGLTIVCGTLLAGLLAWVGAHMVARGQTLQSICVSQGAQCGVSFTLLVAAWRDQGELQAWQGFLGSLVGSVAIGVLGSKASVKDPATKSGLLLSLWLVLISINALFVSVHPAMSSHQSKAFSGDLVSITEIQGWVGILWAILGLSLIWRYQSDWLNITFEKSVLNKKIKDGKLEALIFLGTLVFSTWLMGFLFTSACLIIPTSLSSFMSNTNAKRHFLVCLAGSFLAVPIGFILSLKFGQIPTVPAIVLCLVLIFLVFSVLFFVISKLHRPRRHFS